MSIDEYLFPFITTNTIMFDIDLEVVFTRRGASEWSALIVESYRRSILVTKVLDSFLCSNLAHFSSRL